MTDKTLSVFVAEDEALLKMLLTDMLVAAGCRIVGWASTVTEALSIAGSVEADLALLDVTLFDQEIFPVAATLSARGIPIIFCTGYSGNAFPAEWQEHPLLRKPFTHFQLSEIIAQTMRKH